MLESSSPVRNSLVHELLIYTSAIVAHSVSIGLGSPVDVYCDATAAIVLVEHGLLARRPSHHEGEWDHAGAEEVLPGAHQVAQKDEKNHPLGWVE